MNPPSMRIRMILVSLAVVIGMHIYNTGMVNGRHFLNSWGSHNLLQVSKGSSSLPHQWGRLGKVSGQEITKNLTVYRKAMTFTFKIYN